MVALISVYALWEVCHVVHLNQCVNVNLHLVYVSFNQLLDSFLPETLNERPDQGYSSKDDHNVAVNSKDLHQYCIDWDPEVDVYETSTEDTHELIVVWNLLVVLVAKHSAWDHIGSDKYPAADLSVAKVREGAHYWPVNYQTNFKARLKTTQAVLLHRLSLIEEHCNDQACRDKYDQE